MLRVAPLHDKVPQLVAAVEAHGGNVTSSVITMQLLSDTQLLCLSDTVLFELTIRESITTQSDEMGKISSSGN